MVSIAVAALLPPPFPFKAFNLTAGVLKIRWVRFVVAVAVGRFVRFSIEAVLAVQFGDEAMVIIKRHGLKVLGVVAIAGLAFWAYRRYRSRSAAVAEE
ncbi:MAG: hypothetical protein IPF82_19250 [Blastocatellia bacterium]|nr:hypothetical protein [Blastocatellia bacterium]